MGRGEIACIFSAFCHCWGVDSTGAHRSLKDSRQRALGTPSGCGGLASWNGGERGTHKSGFSGVGGGGSRTNREGRNQEAKPGGGVGAARPVANVAAVWNWAPGSGSLRGEASPAGAVR